MKLRIALSTIVLSALLACPQTARAQPTPFLTGFMQGYQRRDFSGFVGCKITVGANPITVTSLGRVALASNGQAHIVKLVGSNGTDVPGASVVVAMPGTPLQFKYMLLPVPVTLTAGSSYFLVSQEVYGGDLWFESGTVRHTVDAVVNSSVYYLGGWNPIFAADTCYVPVSFEYSLTSPLPPPPPPPLPPAPPTPSSERVPITFHPTAPQAVFTIDPSYIRPAMLVFDNGLLLEQGVDYTVTGATVTLRSPVGGRLGDVIQFR